MHIIADTHVHLYSVYEQGLFLDSAARRLAGFEAGANSAVKVLCLTERYDCDVFETFSKASGRDVATGWKVSSTPESEALWLEQEGGGRLLVLAGSQVVTRERLEVLALVTRTRCEDGLPVESALEAVREAGGVPVLPWAPGKWFFARGQILQGLIDRSEPGAFLLGDSSLRPVGWPVPALLNQGKKKGFRVVAGSDPLPFAGEESIVGTYATHWLEEAFDLETPATSMRNILTASASPPVMVGRRSGPFGVPLRLWRNARSKREAGRG